MSHRGLEKALKIESTDGKLSEAEQKQVALALFAHRADYELASRSRPERALKDTQADLRTDEWHRVAANKGVLLLARLRAKIGAEKFDRLMDEFGKEHAGKTVRTEQFVAHVKKVAGSKMDEFLTSWLEKTGLPGEPRTGPFSVLTFHSEIEQTLIVFGTEGEPATNREAAEALQQAIRARWTNVTVPIKSDKDVTDEELKTNHLLLIGRPETNRVSKRLASAVPVKFGRGSFTVDGVVYAHARTAMLAAGENPLERRFSLVMIAGLDAASTLRRSAAGREGPASCGGRRPAGGFFGPVACRGQTVIPFHPAPYGARPPGSSRCSASPVGCFRLAEKNLPKASDRVPFT